jgi:hypothetical protein
MWVQNAHENCVLALITPLHDYYYYNHHLYAGGGGGGGCHHHLHSGSPECVDSDV